ncbi:putative minor capsid protein [Eel River basin pequenovirus]|nr:putative minor capsid protein [Eel River basin pequenovirus]
MKAFKGPRNQRGVLGSLISAGASIFGSLSSAKGQRDANRLSAEEAQKNRDFQERMSNTAVQRRMEDMRKAGINPLLAAKYDASTPAGSMTNFGNVGLAGAQGAQLLGTAASSAFAANLTNTQIKKIDQEVENLAIQHQLTSEQVAQVKQLTKKAWEETHNLKKQGQQLDYALIVDSIITKFKQDNPNVTIMQNFGLDGKALGTFVSGVLRKGF